MHERPDSSPRPAWLPWLVLALAVVSGTAFYLVRQTPWYWTYWLNHGDWVAQARAARSLSELGPDARSAEPDLLRLLHGVNFAGDLAAIDALLASGVPKKTIVHELIAAIHEVSKDAEEVTLEGNTVPLTIPAGSPRIAVRTCATIALGKNIGRLQPEASDAIPGLIADLDGDRTTSDMAASALGFFGPDASAALPKLRALAASSRDRSTFEDAIGRIERK